MSGRPRPQYKKCMPRRAVAMSFAIAGTRFDGLTIADLSLGSDPFLGGNPTSDFGRFTSTQAPLNETKAGRVMQFALRYTF